VSFWSEPPAVPPNEPIVFQAPGAVFRRKRLCRGFVTVTARRVLFNPNRLDSVIGVKAEEFPLSEVFGTRVVPASREGRRERGAGAGRHVQVEVRRRSSMTVLTTKDIDALVAAIGGKAL
jgi:hypothetical protein